MSSADGDRGDPSRPTWDELTPLPLEGHGPLESDSWTEDPDDENERYQGRRRAEDSPRRWRRVVGGLALLALIVVGALVFRPGQSDPGTEPASTPNSAVDNGSTNPAANSTATASATPTPSSRPSASTPPTAKSGFGTLTVEAEAGPPRVSLTGSAHVTPFDGASGGRVVVGIGNSGGGPPGTLRINDVNIPRAGGYQITIYYTNADSPGSHTAVVSGFGAQPSVVTFSGGRKCCGVRTVQATLAAGTYSITIGNPDAPGPTIDKIVVSVA